MKTKPFKILIMIAFVCSLSVFAEETKKETSKLVKVPAIKVCMVNDKLFDKDQIAVDVDGKTYYGCCEMCKKTLAEKKEFRFAIDPVSGKQVDKAIAVIGADAEGQTLYFENEDNLKKYNSGKK